jgi:sodium transport system permease protein
MSVFKKEMLDSSRDRRSILAALAFSFFGPALLALAFTAIAQKTDEIKELTIAIQGAEYASDLVLFLNGNDIRTVDFTGDTKQAIQNREQEVVLNVSADYRLNFTKSSSAVVELFADYSIENSARAARRVNDVISLYNANIGSLRLMARGINPSITTPVYIEARDYSTQQGRSALILGGLQIFILMAAFVGSTGVAIDTTAGERERHSLEPLLVHPVSSSAILTAKWLTTSAHGMLAVILTLLVTATIFPFVPLETLGLNLTFNPWMQFLTVVLAIPLALFAAAIQMLTSLFAKTFKEAQGYLSLLIMVPMLPVMAMQVLSLKSADWMYLVPVLGQQQLLTSVMRGEELDPLNFFCATSLTSILALATILLLTRLLRTERVVYGGS